MQALSQSDLCSHGFIQLWSPDTRAIRAEIIAGLQAGQAAIAPKYFYDALGSRLFEAVCELPEYYPTRTEAAVLESSLMQIARAVGRGGTLIDLGAGNCAKAARLLPALQPSQYVPVDISVDFLAEAVERLRHRFPRLPILGIGMDFAEELALPEAVATHQRLFFYPGSSIGNFTPSQALHLLRRIRAAGGDLLIGVDLVKDMAPLEAAYDDALGVTAAFNRNLLLHVNRLIGADFAVEDWQHRAFFNAAESRIEMHLVARRDLAVRWQGGERAFVHGESIHTESSYKYTRERFFSLLEAAGFRHLRSWEDPRGWFMVCLASEERR
ncbi:MAG TPA: L-histidine N(alpha)-methyltransferase [Noviherbaspirillum sp.]|nr:L-histidine N(alpha)-methyltransferase [Noviherbaspirillum sp.]